MYTFFGNYTQLDIFFNTFSQKAVYKNKNIVEIEYVYICVFCKERVTPCSIIRNIVFRET